MKLSGTKLDISNYKAKPNPLFKGLPSRLKDPKNYEETENILNDLIKSEHKHKKPSQWLKCKECQQKFNDRKKKMKELGFKSIVQYLEWKKIMNIIINKQSFQLQ